MSQTVRGIKYYLADDCDTLVCKLENEINDMYMDDSKYSQVKTDSLEADLEELKLAIRENNKTKMQYMLNKYSHWFKRYR